ncbi:MAG TPA: ATP-binding cassette domain-containing protein [Terriglobales bacterium]|nr:ATP-binding cassette domain-containing protein [Terriglobales bacterium]
MTSSAANVPVEPRSVKAVAVRLEEVRHSYGEREALRGVSFEVNTGEILGLLGPNGSGKTTLFRILSTLMLPRGGRASVMGEDVAGDPNGVRRKIGVVFQSASVDVKLSAAENLEHQGHLYGMSGAALKSRVKEMLERVGLADRASERVETFSGGMQRRVELAKGLMHRPQVLLLDEPTTGLDPGARRELWKYLRMVRDSEGVTVIVTTHLMEEAEHCDRLAILHEGNLVALGTPTALRAQIGGDVIMLETLDPETVAEGVRSRFHLDAKVLDGKVRIEIQDGHRVVTQLVEEFSGMVQSVSVSKPTLEDVFIKHTGHKFWWEQKK